MKVLTSKCNVLLGCNFNDTIINQQYLRFISMHARCLLVVFLVYLIVDDNFCHQLKYVIMSFKQYRLQYWLLKLNEWLCYQLYWELNIVQSMWVNNKDKRGFYPDSTNELNVYVHGCVFYLERITRLSCGKLCIVFFFPCSFTFVESLCVLMCQH